MANAELDNINQQQIQLFDLLVTNDKASKLPEQLFVTNFLPYFCGELNIDTNEDVLPYWFSIAGSPNKEVSIIDGRGIELYKVPALSDTSIIDPTKEKGKMNFGEIVSLAKLYTNLSPAQGQNFINDKLAEKFYKLTAKSKIFTDNEKRWYDIFARYGKIKPDDVGKIEDDKASKLSDDELEF